MSAPGPDPRPIPPREPDPAECCGGGCQLCVLDVYAEALASYECLLADWQLRHSAETGDRQNA